MGRWSSKIQWTICKSAFLNTDTPIWTLLRCTSEGRKFQELNRVMQILSRISSPMFNVSLSSKTPPTSPPVNSYAASTPKHKCPLPWKSRGKKKMIHSFELPEHFVNIVWKATFSQALVASITLYIWPESFHLIFPLLIPFYRWETEA